MSSALSQDLIDLRASWRSLERRHDELMQTWRDSVAANFDGTYWHPALAALTPALEDLLGQVQALRLLANSE